MSKFYNALDELQGKTNRELLETTAVRQAFYWITKEFEDRDEPAEVRSRAYILFLRQPDIGPLPERY